MEAVQKETNLIRTQGPEKLKEFFQNILKMVNFFVAASWISLSQLCFHFRSRRRKHFWDFPSNLLLWGFGPKEWETEGSLMDSPERMKVHKPSFLPSFRLLLRRLKSLSTLNQDSEFWTWFSCGYHRQNESKRSFQKQHSLKKCIKNLTIKGLLNV